MIESVSESITVSSDSIKKKPIRVLHVDNDPSFLKVAKQILEMKDELEVETVCSVEEAQRKMKERNYDVIVSDYKLQGKDCLQFLKELRSKGNHIPFLVFAGRSREEIAIEALNLGADNYVNKHDDPEKAYTELTHDIHNAVRISKAEEILRKSEETLKLALKASGAGMWNYDFSEKRMTWSSESYALHGLEPGSLEPSGKNWLSCVHPDDRDRINKGVTHAIKSKRYLANEYRVVWPDGTVHYLNDKGRVFYDGNGMPLRMTGISIDVTEDKKREEESRRLASIVESSGDAIIGKSLDGTIVSWNTGAQRIYGYISEEAVGKPISILIPPELHEEMAVILKKIQEGENVDHYETIRVTKDQKKIWVSLSVSPIKDANGIITGASTIARDITKRKETETALQESEEKYHSLFDQSPIGIGLATLDGKVIDSNKAMQALMGYTREELKQIEIISLYEKSEQRNDLLARASAELKRKGAVEGFQVRLKRKNGSPFDALINVSQTRANGQSLIQTTIQDMTERKKWTDELKASEERLRILFEYAPDAYYLCDLSGNFVDGNKAAEEITGYDKKELMGKSFLKLGLLPKCQISRATKLLDPSVLGKPKGPDELTLNRKDGSTATVEIRTFPTKIQDKELVLGIARDITDRKEKELELRESELKYRTIFEGANDGIIIVEPSTRRIIFANPAICKLTMYPEEELLKLKVEDLHPKKAMPFVLKQLKTVSKGRTPRAEAIPVLRKDRRLIYCHINASKLEIEKQSLAVAFFRDVTERKKAEETLQESEERFRAIFEGANDGILAADAKTKRFFLANPRICEITGYSLEELLRLGVDDIHAKRDLPYVIDSFTKQMKGKMALSKDIPVLRKDGRVVYCDVNAKPLRIGSQECLVGLFRDVTESKEAERLILESQKRFAALFTGNPEATVYADQGSNIIDVNPRFESLFGYTLDEVKGKKINDVILPQELLVEGEMLEKKAAEGYVSHETIRKRRDGTLVSVSVSASRVFIRNRLTGYISVYKDISEQVNSHKKLSLMNEKLRVVGGLTRHDIRNKMTAIVGNAYLAKKEAAGNGKALQYLKEIEKAVQQSVRLFDFAKTYEMLGAEELTNIDVGKAFSDAASLITDLKGVALIDNCHGLTVLADSLLQQLFYNLIDNSLKYGERTKRITIRCEKNGRGDLELIYEDDGAGILASQKTKLFSEGYSTGGSTGYGLYLIKKMTETYGWTIEEAGEPGKGARFVIQIPKRNVNGNENYRIAQ